MKLFGSTLILAISIAFSSNAQQVNQTGNSANGAIQTPIEKGSTLAKPLTNIQTQTVNYSAPTSNSTGQHYCTSHELNEKHYSDRGILKAYNNDYYQSTSNAANLIYPTKTPGVNEIAIIFHVVHNPNNPSENVSNALIMQVYQDLTEDFQKLNADTINARTSFGFNPADPNINFCLATQDPQGNPLTELGVIRVSTTEDWYDSNNGEENKMKSAATGGSQIWDRNDYLNVWICDISNGASSGTAGYAYRPTPTFLPGSSIDGIVIDYNLGVNNQNVLTHEVGHYLGLDHTWGGSGSCSSDDGFADTPNTQGPSFNYSGSCSGSQQTCGTTETQYENYMDYSNCTVMFTQEQSNYMLSILQGIRSSLLISPGCDPTNTPPNSAFISLPSGPGPVIIPQNAAVNFIDQSTNNPTSWAWTISGVQGTDWNYSGGTSATSQDPQVTFYNIGSYTVTLTASNSFGADPTPATETNYVQVVGAAAGQSCDTLRNWNPANSIYTLSTSNGYIHGNTSISTQTALEWAEMYTASSTTQVKGLEYAPTAISGTGNVVFRVYSNSGGQPGTVIASETVALNTITQGSWNNVTFTTPATVTGNFWVGYQLSYSGIDTFALYSDYAPGPATNYAWVNLSTSGWTDAGPLFSGSPGFAHILDVLTSNGTAPTMTFSATEDEICAGGSIAVNGSASTFNIDYRWYQTNDPWTTTLDTSTAAGATFTFPNAGNFNIYLFGSGACIDDGVFLPITVNPSVAATVTPSPTTCGNNNGSITITNPTGGDGTYSYSLDGVNYQSGSTFNNLPSGTYTVYVMTAGDNCETTYSVTVGSTPPVSASATTNVTICPGQSADITASGGTSYQWYDGATSIGTTATVTVSPNATSQYMCIVTDGNGCQATVYTTVTVGTPTATITMPDTLCANHPLTTMTGFPSGGTFTGTGVSGTQFDPSVAGIGTHSITYMYDDGAGCGDTVTIDIYVDGCAGINEYISTEIKLYPNPADDYFIIAAEGDFDYELIDAKGRLISTGKALNKINISTVGYEAGIYIVTVSTEAETQYIRLLLQ